MWICFTLPIWLSCNWTFIPWGWCGDLVRILFTMPWVIFPVFWSCLRTMPTLKPGFMFFLVLASVMVVCGGIMI